MRRRTLRRIGIGASVVALSLLAACGSHKKGHGKGTSGGGKAKRVIAVIPKGTTHEYWKSVHAGANQAGSELGVQILWQGPTREDDRAAQVRVLEDVISRGVAGIVLAPLDDTALVPTVREAKAQGIPVVIIDSALHDKSQVSFVATDNEKGGRLAARRLGQVLGGHGKVLVMRYEEGSASTMARESGFLEEVQQHLPDIQIVSDDQYGGATTESAYRTAENLLVRFTELDGIFTPNESTTFGMLRALEDANRAGHVHFVGFDSSKKLVQALHDRKLDGLVVQNPVKIGKVGVETMVHHLDHQRVPHRIDTGCTVATPDNMTDPAVHALLVPDLSALHEH